MKIFYRRPLSLILCIMLGAFSFFAFSSHTSKYFFFIIPVLIFLFSFVRANKIFNSRIFIRIISLTMLLSMLFSHLYFDLYYKAGKRFGDDELPIVCTVDSVSEGEYYSKFTVITENIDGKPFTKYKLLLTLDKDEAKNISVNDKISLTGVISDFKGFGEDFNYTSYYSSRGFSGEITKPEKIKFISKESASLTSKLTSYRNKISEHIINISDTRSGALYTALLLGDKTYLSQDITLDFSRIGITHLLALSGMNLTILILGLSKIIALLGIGKKPRYLINILLTVVYMAITGFPVSVVRAGVMLIIASLLFLFASSHDTMTALFVSVAFICAVTPYAIFDLGLWLSAFATLGIVALLEMKRERKELKLILKIIKAIKDAAVVSLFAVGATFAITLFNFQSVSVISPLSTMIFSLILEIFFYIGTLLLLLFGFEPIHKILSLTENLTAKLAGVFSDFEFSLVSSDFPLLKILTLIFSVYFFLFLVMDVKKKRLNIGIISMFMCSILITGAFLGMSVKQSDSFEYSKTELTENFTVSGGGEFHIITEASYTSRSAYDTLSVLNEKQVFYIDECILTNYNSAMPAYVEILLSNTVVKFFYIPQPQNNEEREILRNIKELSKSFRTNIITYDTDDEICLKNIKFEASYRKALSKSSALNAFNLYYHGICVSYLSSGMLRDETKTAALKTVSNSDNIILGRHGASYYNYSFVYLFKELDRIVFSSKNIYIPNDVISFYEKQGTEVYNDEVYLNIDLRH